KRAASCSKWRFWPKTSRNRPAADQARKSAGGAILRRFVVSAQRSALAEDRVENLRQEALGLGRLVGRRGQRRSRGGGHGRRRAGRRSGGLGRRSRGGGRGRLARGGLLRRGGLRRRSLGRGGLRSRGLRSRLRLGRTGRGALCRRF